jgi:anti-anti-sigma regulatory factor
VNRSAGAARPPGQGSTLRIAFTSLPPGLRLIGEVDTTLCDALSRALATAAGAYPGDVHADLGGVSFIDVDGLRALVAAAGALASQRMLILDSVPWHVARLLELMGWDEAPGLRVEVGGRP